MINKISIAHINYTEEINTTFPKLLICKSHDNNGILNLELTFNQSINDIYDDLSFDNEGKYISICIGQWHHKTTGKYISFEDFMFLDDLQVQDYEYIELYVKIYSKREYKILYHNYFGSVIKVSLIPKELLTFNNKKSKRELIEYEE